MLLLLVFIKAHFACTKLFKFGIKQMNVFHGVFCLVILQHINLRKII